MLLVPLDPLRVPETWRIDDSVTLLVMLIAIGVNCKVSRDILGYGFRLSICVLHDDLVAEGVLLIDHCKVIDYSVQES